MSEIDIKQEDQKTMQPENEQTGEGVVPPSSKRKTPRRANNKIVSLEDANSRSYISRHLFSTDRIPDDDSPHHRLFMLVARHLLEEFVAGNFVVQNELSMLSTFYERFDASIYQGNTSLQTLVYKLLDQQPDKDSTPVEYLYLTAALMEVLNLSILNYSVYLDKRIFTRFKLFDIIETTVFTQIFPTEVNHKRVLFKQNLTAEINTLRQTLVDEYAKKSSQKKTATPPKQDLPQSTPDTDATTPPV